MLAGRNDSGKSNALDVIEVLARLAEGEDLADALDGRHRDGGPVRGGSADCAPDGQTQFSAGTLHTGSVIYDVVVWWDTLDLVRLIGWIAESHKYTGNWLLGAELTEMRGRRSATWGNTECDADQLTATSQSTTRQLLDRPREVASALLRPLFRDLGSEKALDQLEGAPLVADR